MLAYKGTFLYTYWHTVWPVEDGYCGTEGSWGFGAHDEHQSHADAGR